MSTSATYAVNLPLTNYIIGWYGTQTHDPARFLAPGTQAPGLLTTYKRYLRQDAFAASDTRRPMYDSPPHHRHPWRGRPGDARRTRPQDRHRRPRAARSG